MTLILKFLIELVSLLIHTDLLSFNFLNKLGFFSKFAKNSIIFVIFNIFIFRTNYVISKEITQLFCSLLI